RPPQSLPGLRSPPPRDHLPPLRCAGSRVVVRIHIAPSDHAQRVTQTKTTFGSDALGLAEIFHHSAQPLPVNFHPTPSNQREPVRFSQQLAHLGRGQCFAVERDVHAKIEQRILAHTRQQLTPNLSRYLRARRSVRLPGLWHSHHYD